VTNTYALDTSPTGLEAAFIRYRSRCEDILSHVFGRNFDTKRALSDWLTVRFEESESKIMFLHEDPFYRVASYLGFDRDAIPNEYIEAVSNLARERGW